MALLEMGVDTALPPDKVLAALLDFTPRRPEIWPGLTASLYEVYSVGETSAEIKEGTKMPGLTIWAREHYDWSTPGTVRWTVMESNFSAVGNYVAVQVTPRDGGSHMHITWERSGTNRMGRIIVRLMVLTKGKAIRASVKKALDKLAAEGSTRP